MGTHSNSKLISETMLNVKLILINLSTFAVMNTAKCSIDGISYMDLIRAGPFPGAYRRGEDPCNPLYWYPKSIPEYCNYRNFVIPAKPMKPPLLMPLPVPVPQPSPILPMPHIQATAPILPPIPYGVPVAPSNPMLPVALSLTSPFSSHIPSIYSSVPSSYHHNMDNIQQSGMVPGLPGLVTREGGINILPFSDAYSDMIENHKNKMIRRRLQKLINEYEDFPSARNYRQLKKYARRNM